MIISGNPSRGRLAGLNELGVRSILLKPFNVSEFETALKSVLSENPHEDGSMTPLEHYSSQTGGEVPAQRA